MHLTARQRATWLAHFCKAVTQRHDRDPRRLFAPHVPLNAVVMDIGAHAGQFSKLFAKMARGGTVHAFAPSAYARSIMAPAPRPNRVLNVKLLPVGLSDPAGSLTLHTPPKRSTVLGYGTAHQGASARPEAPLERTVALTTLHRFAAAAGLKGLDLIKADKEGWELHALLGGEAIPRRHGPASYLAVDDACLARAGDTPAALFGWPTSLAYRALTTPDLSPVSGRTGSGDYLFTAGECR